MMKAQIKEVLDRVLTWAPERQQEAAELLTFLESQEGELYHPSDDEWLAIQEGLDQTARGEVFSEREIFNVGSRR